MNKTPLPKYRLITRFCALPFAAFFAVSASAATVSWTSATDAAWSKGENWTSGVVQTDSGMAVFDASSMTDLNLRIASDASAQDLKITTMGGLITIGGTNSLTLGAGGMSMSVTSQNLLLDALAAFAAEQSRKTEIGQTMTAKGLIHGAEVNLNKIGAEEQTLSGTNASLAVTTIRDEALNGKGSLNGTTGTKLIQPDFATLGIGAVPRQSPKLNAVRFNEGSGVVQSGPRGGKRTMKITLRGAVKTGANATTANATTANATTANAGGTTEDFRAALELPRGTGPLSAQNGDERLTLNRTASINTDAINVTLGDASIGPVIYQNAGRQFTTVRFLPLVSPPTLTGTSISVAFGNGTQNGNGSGPGAISNFWNNINATPWNGGGFPYGTNGNGHGPFSSDTPTAIGIKNSNGTTLGTPVTIQSFDAGQQFAISNNGAYGGWGSTGTGASIGLGTNPYDQQFALFQTSANSQPANLNCTLTFANIPFATYNAYVGGKNLYQGAIYGVGIQINGAATFLDQSGSTFQLVAAWGHPYDGLGGKISYLQLVNTTFYWKGATNGTWTGSPTNFTSDLAGTQAETGTLTSDVHVVFNANGAANFVNTTLGGNQTIKSLTFGANATSAVGIGGSDTLTITPSSSTIGVTVANLSGNHVISSNVALGANQTWTVTSASQILTARGVVSGNFALTKAGSGTLVFTGGNTYSGATTISAGTLQLGDGGLTGSISNLSAITDNGTLAIKRSNTTTQGTDFGLVAGSGGLTQTGAGTTILNLANSYTGPTTVSTGTLQLGAGGATGSISALSSLTNNSMLVVNRSNTATQGTDFGLIAGTGGFTQAGSGTTILNLANTFIGATTISAGKLSVGADANLGNANALILDGGTLQISGTVLTSYSAGSIGTHAVTLTPNKTVSFDISNAANVFTVGQVLNQGTGGLTKSGFGTLVLTAANTYSGTTTVNGGTLVIAGSPVGTGATTAINGALLKLDYGTNNTTKIDDAAVLTLGGGTLEMAGGTHVEIVGATTVAAGISTVTRSSGTAVLRMNALANNAGGYINFAASNIASTSTPNDASGILGAWATVGGTDWASNSGVLEGGGNNYITAYTGYTDIDAQAGGAAPNIVDGANTNVRIQNNGVSGNIGLSAATTSVNTLLKNNASLPTTVATAAKTLRVNAIMLNPTAESLTIGAAANDGTLMSATSSGAPDLRLVNNSTGKTLTINAVIADNTVASTLSKSGIGTLVLSGTNTFTGATTISGGTLSVGSDANLGNANALIFDGGTLQITGTALTSYAAGLIGSHAVTLTPGKTVGFDIGSAANTFTVSQILNQGDGGLTKLGVGTLVLTGANTFVGATLLSAGTLSVGADANLGIGNALIFDGGTLQITGTTVNNFGTRTLAFNADKTVGLDINNAANVFTVSQVLNLGAGGLTKSGAGTLVLAAANNYSGATTLSAGTLNLGTSTAIGTGPLVINGGSLDSGAANLINANNNTQSWNGSFAFTGTNSLDLGTGAVAMSTSPTLTVSASTLSVGGNISGTGFGLTKAGAGTLILSGTNAFTGAATLTAGTLSVGVNANLGSANALIFDGGTLQVTGTALNNFGTHTATFNTGKTVGLDIANAANTFTSNDVFSQGSGGLTKAGTGTLVLSGTNTYTGVTTLTAGKLSVGTIGNGGVAGNLGAATNAATNLVFIGGTLQYTGATASTNRNFTINTGNNAQFEITQAGANLTVSGAAPATTGGLIKSGAGAMTISNDQVYTGVTTVSGGTLSVGSGGTLPTLATSGITLANNSNVTFNHSDTVTYNKVISGSGSFTKSGSGVLSLVTNQTYDGATLLDGGTLKLHGDTGYRYYRFTINSLVGSDLAQMSELAFYTSGTNNINGTRVFPSAATGDGGNYGDQLIPALSDNNLNTKCTYNGLPNNSQFGRYITFDLGSVRILTGYDWSSANDSTPSRNPNNFTLFGSNDNTNFTLVNSQTNAGSTPTTTFTWAAGWATGLVSGQDLLPTTTNVTISNAGILALDNANQQIASLAGSIGTSVTNSGTTDRILTISGTSTTTFSGVISNGATNKISLVKAGNGTQILAGNNTYTGPTTINAGTLQLGNGGTTGSISINSTLTDNGTLAINRSNTATQGVDFGLITGTGGFTQAGSGTTILNLVNTYTGDTNVNAGTLAANVSGTISGSTIVNSGGTLAGDGGSYGNVTVKNGGALSPGRNDNPTGTLTLNGNLVLETSSNFNVQFDVGAGYVDAITVNGNLNITIAPILNAPLPNDALLNVSYIGLAPVEPGPNDPLFPNDIITYTGTWNGGTFLGLPDDTIFASGGIHYLISYNDLAQDSINHAVTLTIVPEPGAAVSLLGGLALLLGVRRRRA